MAGCARCGRHERSPGSGGPEQGVRRGIAAADINVSIEPDEVVGVIGANGAGKTTFINMVTGYLVPDSGSIKYHGQEITGRTPAWAAPWAIAIEAPMSTQACTAR